MGALLQQLGIELPIIQAGMGGGLAGHELAAAVADAGGLGTIGILGPEELRAEIAAVRRATDGPLAVNLLIPFARPAHFEAASEADVVVTFWGGRSAARQRPGCISAAPSKRRSPRARPGPTR